MMSLSDSFVRLVSVLLQVVVIFAPMFFAVAFVVGIPAMARGKRLAFGILCGGGVAMLAALVVALLSIAQAQFRTLCGDGCFAQGFVLVLHAGVSLGIGFLLCLLLGSSRRVIKRQAQTLHVGLGLGLAFWVGLSLPVLLNLRQSLVYGRSLQPETAVATPPSSPAPTPLVANSEWFSCATNKDCTIGEGICGVPAAYNNGQREEFLHYVNTVTFGLNCPPYAGFPRDQISAVCFAKQCVLSCSDLSICITR